MVKRAYPKMVKKYVPWPLMEKQWPNPWPRWGASQDLCHWVAEGSTSHTFQTLMCPIFDGMSSNFHPWFMAQECPLTIWCRRIPKCSLHPLGLPLLSFFLVIYLTGALTWPRFWPLPFWKSNTIFFWRITEKCRDELIEFFCLVNSLKPVVNFFFTVSML